jgi:hypothetical protein
MDKNISLETTAAPRAEANLPVTPPRKWTLVLWPAFLAVLGMFIAVVVTTAGQNTRRHHEELQITYDLHYWKLELAKAQMAQKPAAEIALIQKIVDTKAVARVISYARFGRQFTQWDGYRYEEIVDQGYVYHQPWEAEQDRKDPQPLVDTGEPEKRSKNTVWYPLYPFLASGVMYYANGLGLALSSTNALTGVSWACCLLGAMVTFAYARRYYFAEAKRFPLPQGPGMLGANSYDSAALWVVVALLFGPCACFLYANFTESLFVLLLALFLYCVQARWWWRAALVAAFASATRSQGVLFGPVLALTYLVKGTPHSLPKRVGLAAVMGVISALGLMGFMAFLQTQFGDPLAFMHAQRYWNVGLGLDRLAYAANPEHALSVFLGNFVDSYYIAGKEIEWPRVWEAACLLWPPVMLLVWGWRYLSLELQVIAWLMWGLPYVSNSMAGQPIMDSQWMSMGRFMSVSLPMYIMLGAMLERRRWAALLFMVPWVTAYGGFLFKFGSGAWVG